MACKSAALATRPASDVALVEEPDSVGASGPLDLSGLTSIVGPVAIARQRSRKRPQMRQTGPISSTSSPMGRPDGFRPTTRPTTATRTVKPRRTEQAQADFSTFR